VSHQLLNLLKLHASGGELRREGPAESVRMNISDPAALPDLAHDVPDPAFLVSVASLRVLVRLFEKFFQFRTLNRAF
jgi:hypothetical protein